MIGVIRTILEKELREVLRDRRTLVLMVGIPAFLYPALVVLMEQVLLFGQGALGESVPRVAVAAGGAPSSPANLPEIEGIQIVPLSSPSEEAVLSGRIDALLVVDSTGAGEARGLDVSVIYDGSRDRSVHARTLLLTRLDSINDRILANRLERFGLPEDFARPIAVRDTSIATPEGLGGATLGRFLPMVLIMMTVLGAFHPAIDIAAGERERRTLEPLLTTGTPASAIVIGKYLAVALIAFTAAVLNLVSMLLTLNAGIFQFTEEMGIEFSLPVGAILLTLLLLALLALLFSALFLGVAVHAQSFREAQTSLTPIYILSFLPGIVTMVPGIEFSLGIALIPIAGVALVFRALMAGDPMAIEWFVAVAATFAYAAFALSFAASSFSREDVLIGDAEDDEVRRSAGRPPWWNPQAAPLPTPSVALLFVASIGILYFYFGVGFQQWGERGLLASQWLLLAVPTLLFLRMGRYRWREALGVRPAHPVSFLAGILIVLGGLPIGWLLAWLQTFVLEVPEELLSGMQGLLTADEPLRVAWLLFLVALTPALCEEIVFRGVLLQGFLQKMTTPRAILASALVFGIFHLSFETAIRLLPTMFIGALLGLVAARARSILPSMVMHFANNAAAVLLVSTPTLQGWILTDSGTPNWFLVPVGVVLLAIGSALLPPAPVRAGAAVEPEASPDAVAPQEA